MVYLKRGTWCVEKEGFIYKFNTREEAENFLPENPSEVEEDTPVYQEEE